MWRDGRVRFKAHDSKCVELCGSHVAENLDFMGFSKPSEFELG